jgi:hypothetical protein
MPCDPRAPHILAMAAAWWQAEPDSPARAMVTAWALCPADATGWRQALADAAPAAEVSCG